MIAGLSRFVTELRREGLAVSPAEWIEAVRAVEWVGLDDRERFRAALRCTLAKRSRQQATFDRTFERFFAAPGRSGERQAPRPGGGIGLQRGRREDRAHAAQPARSAEIPTELARLLDQVRDGKPRCLGRLRHVVVAPSPRAAAASDPLRCELHRRLEPDAERDIAAVVPRVIESIRLRSARRARRAPRGGLDLRRVFRENLASGGVPFVLPRRRRVRRRARVFLMIDVSWSTARAAGFFLALADEFLRRARDARVTFFVDRAVDATGEVAPGCGLVRHGAALGPLLRALPGLDLGAPSDYGRAFHTVLRSPRRPAGRGTLLVVLGDGRSNRLDPQEWVFEEIAERCGAVLWLVPEPVARWGTGDSALGSYLRHVDVAVEAVDLAGLARGVSEIVRRL